MRIVKLTKETTENILENMLKRSPTQYGTYEASVQEIIENVKTRKDAAVFEYTEKFDHVVLSASTVEVTQKEIDEAYNIVDPELIGVIRRSMKNIRAFHEKQKQNSWFTSTENGTMLGQKLTALNRVGVYVPGGKAAYPSSVLMNILPAKVAGVREICMTTPCGKDGKVNPVVLAAAKEAGADRVFKVGGAQAIAAMAYGTESIGKVDLIAGPGNRYVTEAKRQVMGTVGIDSLAGPSEVLIVADETANPEYIAIDLLAQSEHDAFAQSTLIITDESKVPAILKAMEELAAKLPTGEAAMQSFADNGTIIIADDMDEMAALANEAAPEHLEVHTKDPVEYSQKLYQFGSLFIGEDAPVALGDYCSGTNHTLPTMKNARFSNGVYVGTFLKTSFVQHITKEGLVNLSDTCMTMAHTEGLAAHEMSVRIRLQ